MHFEHRQSLYDSWVSDGEPKVIWIPGLHNPASYLKAIIQTTSRAKGWPLDKTDTYTVVTNMMNESDVQEKLKFGCYLSGLYIEGAEWSIEEKCLVMQKPKTLISAMPLIMVIPAEAAKIKLINNFKTPVYMTQSRKNISGDGLVFEADLRTLKHPNTWVLQGVCMVLNTTFG